MVRTGKYSFNPDIETGNIVGFYSPSEVVPTAHFSMACSTIFDENLEPFDFLVKLLM